jgi:hypothetical protein
MVGGDQQLRASFRPVRRNEEPLFDHPVRSRDKDGWKIEANCFRGFQVDDQFKSARPLDRQVARTRTPQNLVLDVPVPIIHQTRIAELAATYRLPTMFLGGRRMSEAGLDCLRDAANTRVCGKDLRGRQTGRLADRGPHAAYTDIQSQDGSDNWCDDSARAAQTGGSSHRVNQSVGSEIQSAYLRIRSVGASVR